MIYNKHKISLSGKEIDTLIKSGGREELLSFISADVHPIKELIYQLFPETVLKSSANGKIKQLFFITNNPEEQYETAYIKKSNGKKREINKPNPTLKKFQKAIYTNILKSIPVSDCATAYRKGISIKNSTELHIGKPAILKLDIKNFFSSISYKTVREMFVNHGFDYNTATTLTTLDRLHRQSLVILSLGDRSSHEFQYPPHAFV